MYYVPLVLLWHQPTCVFKRKGYIFINDADSYDNLGK